MPSELPINFPCHGDRVYGVVYRPDANAARGILMVQGRPAYRVGPHRLYVELARHWSANGFPVMRFDYCGSGDSEGRVPLFEDTAQEIRSAIDAYQENVSGLKEVILWCSCAGAADAIAYANTDSRVAALALFNPWAWSAKGRARTRIFYHAALYLKKIRTAAWWEGLFRGEMHLKDQFTELFLTLREALGGKAGPPRVYRQIDGQQGPTLLPEDIMDFYHSYRKPDMAHRLGEQADKFKGKILLVLCGQDMVAQAFVAAAENDSAWRKVLSASRTVRLDLPESDHGLRRPEWRERVKRWSLDWLAAL